MRVGSDTRALLLNQVAVLQNDCNIQGLASNHHIFAGSKVKAMLIGALNE
jgi:hypothetical protein